MNSQMKSKKDIAFEKERNKYKRTIRQLSDEVDQKKRLISSLQDAIHEKEEVIRQQEDWIERLLTYTELDKEDMRKLLDQEKATSELVDAMSDLSQIFIGYTGNFI